METFCGDGVSCSDVCSNFPNSQKQKLREDQRECLTVILDDADPKQQAENICQAIISDNPDYCFDLPNTNVFNLQDEYDYQNCPDNFTYFPQTNLCYKYENELKNFSEAETYCSTLYKVFIKTL